MNIYVKINSIQYSIESYSYRLSSVTSDTKISHLLSCVVLTDDIISDTDTIEFYSDDVLVYTDPINDVIKNKSKTTVRSDKTVNIPTLITNVIEDILFYSSTRLRVPKNFSLSPLNTINTPIGNFIAGRVVHYNLYSEIEIG